MIFYNLNETGTYNCSHIALEIEKMVKKKPKRANKHRLATKKKLKGLFAMSLLLARRIEVYPRLFSMNWKIFMLGYSARYTRTVMLSFQD